MSNDPSLWVDACQAHWLQARASMLQHLQGEMACSADNLIEVFNHMDNVVLLLLTEVNSKSDNSFGGCMDYLFTEGVFEQIFDWGQSVGEYSNACKLNQLKMYETLIARVQPNPNVRGISSILVHKPVLQPLLRLLEVCSRSIEKGYKELERHYIQLLNQICVSVSRETALLDFFFSEEAQEGPSKFTVFTLLIPYLYREIPLCQQARDALLLVLSVARTKESIARFVVETTDFCCVVATGISGLYSLLPRRVGVDCADDWHRVEDSDVGRSHSLHLFCDAWQFINAVVQVSHYQISEKLLDFCYHGFLVPVLGSALNQPSLDEVTAAVAYLHLLIQDVTEAQLLHTVMRFVLLERIEETPVLDTLVSYLSGNSRLCLVTLSLFDTLLNLFCEDIMYELVFKYLVPCTHMMASQANALARIDNIHSKSAEMLLSLIPRCCFSTSLANGDVSGFESPDTGSSSVDSSYASLDTSTTAEEVAEGSAMLHHTVLRQSYYAYILDARSRLSSCYLSCSRGWTLPYDGHTPDPEKFRLAAGEEMDRVPSCGEDRRAQMQNVVFPHRRRSELHSGYLSSDGASSNRELVLNIPPPSARSIVTIREDKTTFRSITPDDDLTDMSDNEGGGFKRGGTARQSYTNRYFMQMKEEKVQEHQDKFGALHGISAMELSTLGATDFFKALQGVEELLDEAPASVNTHRPGSTSSNEPLSPQTARRLKPRAGSVPPPPDYLKLTYSYDDDSSSNERNMSGASDTDGYSSSASARSIQVQDPFVLSGWAAVQDESMFLELLDRIKPSSHVVECCDQAHFDYIDYITAQVEDGVLKEGEEQDQSDSESVVSEVHWFDVPRQPVFKSSFMQPNLGPFLNVILSKLECMVTNSLFVNLRLTAVLSTLCCYPQPLLASFLLNHRLVFQPTVRSLTQILSSLKNKIDRSAMHVEQWDSLFRRARQYLADRARRAQELDQRRTQAKQQRTAQGLFPALLEKATKAQQGTRQYERADSDLALYSKPHRFLHRTLPEVQSTSSDMIRTKNTVFCAVILEEFLMEISAIAMEHSGVHIEIPASFLFEPKNKELSPGS